MIFCPASECLIIPFLFVGVGYGLPRKNIYGKWEYTDIAANFINKTTLAVHLNLSSFFPETRFYPGFVHSNTLSNPKFFEMFQNENGRKQNGEHPA